MYRDSGDGWGRGVFADDGDTSYSAEVLNRVQDDGA